MIAAFERAGVRRVGIERGDGPVVEALMRAGFAVVVISARQVRSLRARYGTAGNKDDRFDAFVLADALRTDAGRWHPVQPDSESTIGLRMLVRARQDLIGHRIAVHNQLLAVLQQNFPGAIGLFSQLDIPISLRFLRRFPTQTKAAWLCERRMQHWLIANGYCGRHTAAQLVRHLQDAAHGPSSGPTTEASEQIVLTLVTLLSGLREQIADLEASIREALLAHRDGPIFASLPRAGTVRPPLCWPTSATAAPGSPTTPPLPRPPAWHRQPGNPASTSTSEPPRLQQEPPRSADRLGPGHPASQRLGRGDLPRRPRSRMPTPARRPHPRAGLDPRALALPARRRPLQPRTARATGHPDLTTYRLLRSRLKPAGAQAQTPRRRSRLDIGLSLVLLPPKTQRSRRTIPLPRFVADALDQHRLR